MRVWGYNGSGALGNGTNVDEWEPIPVAGLTSVTVVGAGDYWTHAGLNIGDLWAWGQNGAGQLGDGTTVEQRMPVQVMGLADVTSIEGGDSFTIALK